MGMKTMLCCTFVVAIWAVYELRRVFNKFCQAHRIKQEVDEQKQQQLSTDVRNEEPPQPQEETNEIAAAHEEGEMRLQTQEEPQKQKTKQPRPFRCKYCRERFTTENLRRSHLRHNHSNYYGHARSEFLLAKYNCRFCKRNLAPFVWKKHVAEHYFKMKFRKYCRRCQQWFYIKEAYNQHKSDLHAISKST